MKICRQHMKLALIGAMALFITGCRSSAGTDTSNDIPVVPGLASTETQEEAGELVISQMTDSEIIFSTENEKPEDEKKEEDKPEKPQVEKESEEIFEDVVSSYKRLFEENAPEADYQKAHLNPLLIEFYPDNVEKNVYEVGYAFADIDLNGQSELIIGVNSEVYKGTMIIGLYTTENDSVKEICTSEQNSIYYLGADNRIYNKTSEENGKKFYYKYGLKDHTLTNYETFAYDESQNAEEPWFIVEEEHYQPISRNQAKEMADDFYSEMSTLDLSLFEE